MRKFREVLRLSALGLKQHQISGLTGGRDSRTDGSICY